MIGKASTGFTQACFIYVLNDVWNHNLQRCPDYVNCICIVQYVKVVTLMQYKQRGTVFFSPLSHWVVSLASSYTFGLLFILLETWNVPVCTILAVWTKHTSLCAKVYITHLLWIWYESKLALINCLFGSIAHMHLAIKSITYLCFFSTYLYMGLCMALIQTKWTHTRVFIDAHVLTK